MCLARNLSVYLLCLCHLAKVSMKGCRLALQRTQICDTPVKLLLQILQQLD